MIPLPASPVWRAGAPRFLILTLGCWIVARLAVHGLGDANVPPPAWPPPPPARPYWQPQPGKPDTFAQAQRAPGGAALMRQSPYRPLASGNFSAARSAVDHGSALAGIGASEHSHWRQALLGQFAPGTSASQTAAAVPAAGTAFVPRAVPPLALMPRPAGHADRWSLSFASLWRGGGTLAPSVAPAAGPLLGGSQTALRIEYVVDPRRRLRAYARLTDTPGRGGTSDVALGVAIRPIRTLPVDVHAERRIGVGTGSVNSMLVFAAGGVDNVVLPQDFRLSAYVQAGVADYGPRAGFADGIAVVERQVADHRGFRLSLGQMAAASAQPGASRLDTGPRATLTLPGIGKGAQVALDWRERVAGNARPGRGVALTITADF